MRPEQPISKEHIAKGLFWGGINNGAQQILNLVIGIILARLLTPADYGMVGVLVLFSALASAIQEGGFVSAYTNSKDVSEKVLNAIFWVSTGCGVAFYLLLFFCAPLIAIFYHTPELTSLARFVFIGFLMASLNVAPRAKLFRAMQVKKMAAISIISLIISGIIGIFLAWKGYAYWGLAAQTVSYITVSTILTFFFARWLPMLNLDIEPVKRMLGFSSKIVITNVFNILNNNIFAVLLGKFYSPAMVGDYNQANKWNTMGYNIVAGMVHSVAQPSFAGTVDNTSRQIMIFHKLIRFTAFISFPALLGLSFVAPEFIVFTITDKWIFSAYIMQILCIWGAFFPFFNIFMNLLLSQGRSGAYMWGTIVLSILQMLLMGLTFRFGIFTMVTIYVAVNILWLYVWYRSVAVSLPVKLWGIMRDALPYLFITLLAIGTTHFIIPEEWTVFLRLVCKVLFVTIIYITILKLLGSHILDESIRFLCSRLMKK